MQTILPEKTETQLLSPNNQLFHAEMATMDCTSTLFRIFP